MTEDLSILLAIHHQQKAIKHCKKLREHYINQGLDELASYMVNILVDQEAILIYLESEREQLRNAKKEEKGN